MNLQERAEDFIFIGEDWFAKKYANKSDCRYATFKTALNLYLQQDGKVIVETGCARQHGDYGAGLSSLLFCDFLSRYGGHLWSIDISDANLKVCADITKEFESFRTLISGDSAVKLSSLNQDPNFANKKIDLLYLDSWDYPYGDLLNLYGGQVDIDKAVKILDSLSEKEVMAT